MVTLRQLEYLVAVAERGSFTRAARDLHVSQPALSHQIAVLERDVGGPLLERLSKAVRLTPAGRALIPHARTALIESSRARAAAQRATGASAGELDVASVFSVTLGLLPGPLRQWSHHHPNVRVRLHEYRHGDDMAAAMRVGVADVAIGPPPRSWTGAVSPLGDEELVVVISTDDPLASRTGPIDLAILANRPWVHFAPGHGLAEVLDRACSAAGFKPRVALRTEQTASAPLLAAAGLGPALVPASIIPVGFEGVVFATSPTTRRPLCVYERAGADPLTATFSVAMTRAIELMPLHVATLLDKTESTAERPSH